MYATEKLVNLLTFMNRNIIPVSTWLIWTATQLRVQMNVLNWVWIVFDSLVFSFFSSTDL